MNVLAIDPGSTDSAYVILGEDYKPIAHEKVPNETLLAHIQTDFIEHGITDLAVEMIASYGMPVGKEVFETCVWIGRFLQAADYIPVKRFIYRKDEKMNLCGSMKAKDGNIRQALIDRFGIVGTKRAPGWWYGFSKDQWSAAAVGVTYLDMMCNELKDGRNNAGKNQNL